MASGAKKSFSCMGLKANGRAGLGSNAYLSGMTFPYPVNGRDFPIYLAPMAGVSERPYRLLCRRYGADVVVSEFLSAEGLRRGSDRTMEMAAFQQEERPIGIQIFGSDPVGMAE